MMTSKMISGLLGAETEGSTVTRTCQWFLTSGPERGWELVEASSDSIRGLLYQHYKAVILGRMDRCMVPVDQLFVGRSG